MRAPCKAPADHSAGLHPFDAVRIRSEETCPAAPSLRCLTGPAVRTGLSAGGSRIRTPYSSTKPLGSRRVSVSGGGKALCLVPADEPQSRLAAGLNRRRSAEPFSEHTDMAWLVLAYPGHPWHRALAISVDARNKSRVTIQSIFSVAIFAPQCVPPATTATPGGSGHELRDQLRPAVQQRQKSLCLGRLQADVHSGDAEVAVALQKVEISGAPPNVTDSERGSRPASSAI